MGPDPIGADRLACPTTPRPDPERGVDHAGETPTW
jgi:hypothetical protein